MCARVEAGHAPFRLCYLSVWHRKSALQLSTCSLMGCSFMTFTTDVSFRIVFWSTSRFNLGLPDLWRKCWANKCQFDVVYFLQWDLNGPVMRFGSYCCDTDKRHIFDSTSKTSGIDLPQKTFPSVTTVHTQGIMRLLSHKHNSQAIKSPISLSHILWIKSVKYHICSQSWGTCTNQPPTETQFKHFCDKSWWFYLAFSLFLWDLKWSVSFWGI